MFFFIVELSKLETQINKQENDKKRIKMIDYSDLLICRVCECENYTLFNIYQISNIKIFNNLQELTCKLVEVILNVF